MLFLKLTYLLLYPGMGKTGTAACWCPFIFIRKCQKELQRVLCHHLSMNSCLLTIWQFSNPSFAFFIIYCLVKSGLSVCSLAGLWVWYCFSNSFSDLVFHCNKGAWQAIWNITYSLYLLSVPADLSSKMSEVGALIVSVLIDHFLMPL